MPVRSLSASAALKISAALVMILVTSQYLAGFGFLWRINGDIRDASPLTVARYAYYYGDDPDLRQDLVRCSLAGLLLMGLASMGVLWPRPRKLHGEARFETRARIAGAGLLGDEGIVLGKLGSSRLLKKAVDSAQYG